MTLLRSLIRHGLLLAAFACGGFLLAAAGLASATDGPDGTVATGGYGLNIRNTPALNNRPVGGLMDGTGVHILSCARGTSASGTDIWYEIGPNRWVSAAFVRVHETPAACQPGTPASSQPMPTQGAPGQALLRAPEQYREALQKVGSVCPQHPSVSPSLIAAQIEAESGWVPNAVGPPTAWGQAQGMAQFIPATWESNKMDGDGDGVADPFNPYDAIMAMSKYDCALADTLTSVPGDPVANILAGYNAGPGNVQAAGGVPAFLETQNYVQKIKVNMM